MSLIGLTSSDSLNEATRKKRAAWRRHHPNKGGKVEDFIRVQQEWNDWRHRYNPTRTREAKALALTNPKHHLLADLDMNGHMHHLHDIGDYLKAQMLRFPPDGTVATNWTRTGIPHPIKRNSVIGIRRALKILKRYKRHGGDIDAATMDKIIVRYQQPYEAGRLYGENPGAYKGPVPIAAERVVEEAAERVAEEAAEEAAEEVAEEVAEEAVEKESRRGAFRAGLAAMGGKVTKAGQAAQRGVRVAGVGAYKHVRRAGIEAGESMSDEQFATGAGSLVSASAGLTVLWAMSNFFKLF